MAVNDAAAGEIIASAENKLIKEAARLQNGKWRGKLGKFLLEGAAYIHDLPGGSGSLVECLLVAESRRWEHHELCSVHAHRIVADKLLEQICDTVTPQGIVAICRQPCHDADEIAARGGLYVICEDVRDPGNLGSIIRTAAAAGVEAVFAPAGCAEVYGPKVVRASSGAVLAVPVIQCHGADDAVRLLRSKGTRIYATHLAGGRLPYDTELRGSCAIIIGNEAHGVSDRLVNLCDARIKLPMPGAVQSLNASVAAGIIIYESLRQRTCLR